MLGTRAVVAAPGLTIRALRARQLVIRSSTRAPTTIAGVLRPDRPCRGMPEQWGEIDAVRQRGVAA